MCEIDRLISRELGSADVVENLWAEAYGSSPNNAHLKDKLENPLTWICAGHADLKAAHDMLVNDRTVAAMPPLFHWPLRLRNSKPPNKVLLQRRRAEPAGRDTQPARDASVRRGL
jgi:hypothetical protein